MDTGYPIHIRLEKLTAHPSTHLALWPKKALAQSPDRTELMYLHARSFWTLKAPGSKGCLISRTDLVPNTSTNLPGDGAGGRPTAADGSLSDSL